MVEEKVILKAGIKLFGFYYFMKRNALGILFSAWCYVNEKE
ncbi:MAG: hypothetical protein P9M07_06715 [Candidatus Aceula meridiana]|nr:hypothetical protein [Candidatus Aceula meridiana]